MISTSNKPPFSHARGNLGIKNEKAALAAPELPDNPRALFKQTHDIRGRTIAESYPNAFRRRSPKGPLPEILILGDNHQTV
jgi:hypothetical protein